MFFASSIPCGYFAPKNLWGAVRKETDSYWFDIDACACLICQKAFKLSEKIRNEKDWNCAFIWKVEIWSHLHSPWVDRVQALTCISHICASQWYYTQLEFLCCALKMSMWNGKALPVGDVKVTRYRVQKGRRERMSADIWRIFFAFLLWHFSLGMCLCFALSSFAVHVCIWDWVEITSLRENRFYFDKMRQTHVIKLKERRGKCSVNEHIKRHARFSKQSRVKKILLQIGGVLMIKEFFSLLMFWGFFHDSTLISVCHVHMLL